MPTVRIVIEIEAGETTQTSINLEPSVPAIEASASRRVGAIGARVRRFVSELGDNEKTVVKSVLQASMQGTKVYRKQLMPDLGFSQLLQLNGVLAWITRKYRKWVGEPDSQLIETIYDEEDEKVDDYSLGVKLETPEEVIEALKELLGLCDIA